MRRPLNLSQGIYCECHVTHNCIFAATICVYVRSTLGRVSTIISIFYDRISIFYLSSQLKNTQWLCGVFKYKLSENTVMTKGRAYGKGKEDNKQIHLNIISVATASPITGSIPFKPSPLTSSLGTNVNLHFSIFWISVKLLCESVH